MYPSSANPEANLDLRMILDLHLSALHRQIINTGFQLNHSDILSLILKYYQQKSEISQEQFFKTIIQVLVPQKLDGQQIQAIEKTINGHNFVGNMLIHKNDNKFLKRCISKTQRLISQCIVNDEYNTNQFISNLFLARYLDVTFKQITLMYLKSINQKVKFYKYLKQTRQKQEHWAKFNTILRGQNHNKNSIMNVCEVLQQKTGLSLRQKAILKLYETYISKLTSPGSKYNYFCMIQYLFKISDTQFIEEFDIHDEASTVLFSKFVKSSQVSNTNELKLKVSIAKHVELSKIYINFSNTFNLESIPSNILVRLFSNIKNRMQFVAGKGSWFLILHRVYDHMIFSSAITENNIIQIQDFIKQCSNEQLYDVIIYSNIIFDALFNLKLRYISCYVHGFIDVQLKHPLDLLSASLSGTRISNINQCINLQNLYSVENTYTEADIKALNALKRVFSYGDVYLSTSGCLLSAFFMNELECLGVENYNPESNVISSVVLSQKIKKLRFFSVHQRLKRSAIELNVSHEFPKNLLIFDVETDSWKPSGITYGTITGPIHLVAKLETALLCQPKHNW